MVLLMVLEKFLKLMFYWLRQYSHHFAPRTSLMLFLTYNKINICLRRMFILGLDPSHPTAALCMRGNWDSLCQCLCCVIILWHDTPYYLKTSIVLDKPMVFRTLLWCVVSVFVCVTVAAAPSQPHLLAFRSHDVTASPAEVAKSATPKQFRTTIRLGWYIFIWSE